MKVNYIVKGATFISPEKSLPISLFESSENSYFPTKRTSYDSIVLVNGSGDDLL